MRHHTTVSAALAAAALLTLTACEVTNTGAKPARTAVGQTSPQPTTGKSSGTDEADETAALPNFVGKGLQSAQDEAQAAGFFSLASHDTLGRGRIQALDRNWKVCFQTPAPGSHPTDTTIDFGVVKLDENCPTKDPDEPTEAGGATMPDLKGKSVKVARQTLASDTSISVRDSTGQGRMVIVESNWKVCHLSPEVGAELSGKPVIIDAVKFEENC
jgi:hypothetical protein